MVSYTMHTPVGWIRLEADETALVRLVLRADPPAGAPCPPSSLLADAAGQILEYFQGTRTEFSVPLRPEGTEFQKRVWSRLCAVPYGTTCSYKELAAAAGSARACRAVGNANGKNPIPILIPCHRVIAADGNLGGYSGGLDIKVSLLQLETAVRSLRESTEAGRRSKRRKHRASSSVPAVPVLKGEETH